ncbi:MAG: amino acid ABC transporter substrate-binding protein [Psychromonas sp.]|nr:amino acid ABC transporter substrate-binding protein [Psychromonas sp.]
MKTFKLRLWIILFFTTIFLTACTNSSPFAKNTTYQRIQKTHKMVVGMTGEQPPFNLFVSSQGTIGYDVDVAQSVAKALDAKLEISIMPFSKLQKALKEHKIDMIISAFSISKKRTENLSFSIPYAKTAKSILTTKEKLKTIFDSTGFNHKSINLVALKNSTSVDLAKRRIPNAKITTIPHYEQAIIMMYNGKADALVADLTICELSIIRDTRNDLVIFKKPLSIENIAIATNLNEDLLQSIISNNIKKLIKTGAMDKIHKKWFNDPRWISLLP